MTKNKVLQILLSHPNQTLSGQDIADQLQLSRNAVWKAIKSLQEEGYGIESQPSKGYQLTHLTSQLDPFLIKNFLEDDWKDLEIDQHQSVSSTNDLARLAIEEDPSHRYLILASHQEQGRGRRGRSFDSQLDQGLYMSLAFKPSIQDFKDIPLYTLLTAVALVESLQPYLDHRLAIKWVNDIFYRSRKVIGILSEMVTHIEDQHIPHVVIGIGLNLAGSFDHASEEVQAIAGTLFGSNLPADFNLNRWLADFLNRFARYDQQFEEKEFLDHYRDYMLGINQEISFLLNDIPMTARLLGINQDGHLLVEDDHGHTRTLYGQDIHFSSRQFIDQIDEADSSFHSSNQ